MAKTNAQINAEFSAKSPLEKLGIAGSDIVRIAASGLTGGLVDTVAGGDNVERTREARVRAGLAGDAVNVGGMVLGLKGAGAALRGGYNAVRALPVAATSPAALAKGAGVLALLGTSVAGRQEDTPAAKPAPATTKAAVDKSLASGSQAEAAKVTPQDRALQAIDAILSRPHSLNEFTAATNALPGVAAVSTKQSSRDKIFGAVASLSDTLYAAELANAEKLTGEARDAAVLKATENYKNNLLAPLGVDPTKQALAAIYAQQAQAQE